MRNRDPKNLRYMYIYTNVLVKNQVDPRLDINYRYKHCVILQLQNIYFYSFCWCCIKHSWQIYNLRSQCLIQLHNTQLHVDAFRGLYPNLAFFKAKHIHPIRLLSLIINVCKQLVDLQFSLQMEKWKYLHQWKDNP